MQGAHPENADAHERGPGCARVTAEAQVAGEQAGRRGAPTSSSTMPGSRQDWGTVRPKGWKRSMKAAAVDSRGPGGGSSVTRMLPGCRSAGSAANRDESSNGPIRLRAQACPRNRRVAKIAALSIVPLSTGQAVPGTAAAGRGTVAGPGNGACNAQCVLAQLARVCEKTACGDAKSGGPEWMRLSTSIICSIVWLPSRASLQSNQRPALDPGSSMHSRAPGTAAPARGGPGHSN